MNLFPAIRMGVVALAAVLLLSAAGKRDAFSISFHVQGEENEGSFVMPDVGAPGLFFRINPTVTHNQMTAFYPFLSEDGQTYGAVFKLTTSGAERLRTVIATDPGRLLRAVVNGRPVAYLRIEGTNNLDEIVIWKGMTEADFALFQKKLQRGTL